MDTEYVYLLYVGDAWLSNDSLHLLGVFNDPEALEVYTQDMAAKKAIDDYGFDELNYGSGQCSGIGEWEHRSFMRDTAEVNPPTFEE